MTKPADGALTGLTADHPAIGRVVASVLRAWPEHEKYIVKSLSVRTADVMATTEMLAHAALQLAGERLEIIARHYRWTCDRLREEEIHFHRTGAYRLKTFAEANKEVYSNPEYMEKYVDGLLLSEILWVNHAESCNFYFRETPKHLKSGARMLEIGPGHGLMLYLAHREFGLSAITALDISAVSLEQTRHALSLLDVKGAEFAERDIMDVRAGETVHDLVVLSEILEHLEDPISAMRQVRGMVAEDGLVFVNVPINSPSPDHLYLMESIEDAEALLTETGFEIVESQAFATQGHKLDKALRNRISVSVCMLGRPVG